MEPKQARKLSREKLDEVSSEIRVLMRHTLRDHKDGDAERLLRKRWSGSSNADL